MSIKKKSYIVIAFFVAFAIVFGIYLSNKRLNRKEHMALSYATVVGYATDGNGSAAWFNYKYTIKGKEFTSSISTKTMNRQDAQIFVSRTFPLVYDSCNFRNNHMLVSPNDFAEYDLTFPDSLKWIIPY